MIRILPLLALVSLVTGRSEAAELKKAAFAAGCFWGVEKILAEVPGVVSTRVGYAGGKTANPTYEQVSGGRTGHAEAVEVTYDPSKARYEDILLKFWQYHVPTTPNRQGPDIGSQYRSMVFYYDAAQRAAAEDSIRRLDQARIFNDPIVTEVVPSAEFWEAEPYHQKYLKTNPKGYCSHHFQSEKIEQVLKNS